MRKKNTERILGIDPGTRNLGFALLDNGQLVHYGVKTIRLMKSPHDKLKEGRKIILRFIKDFRPQMLIVEKTFFANNRNSALLNVFADEIKVVGKRKGLRVQGLAANSVRKALCGNGRASKDDVARKLVLLFPELKPFYASDKRWKERFNYNMFDAVALALVASSWK